VDVRDAAAPHLQAMTHPSAKGERCLAVAGNCLSILDIAKLLKARMGSAAKRVEKATRLLGWQPRSSEEAILPTAESLIRLWLLKA
jgi:nucleoside-diphosphate-sugar epimerase